MKFFRNINGYLSEYLPAQSKRLCYALFLGLFGWILLSALGNALVGGGAPGWVRSIADRLLTLSGHQAILQGHVWQFVLPTFTLVPQPGQGPAGVAIGFLLTTAILLMFSRMLEDQEGSDRMFWILATMVVVPSVVYATLDVLTRFRTPRAGPESLAIGMVVLAGMRNPRAVVHLFMAVPVPLGFLAAFAASLTGLLYVAEMTRIGVPFATADFSQTITACLIAVVWAYKPQYLEWLEDVRIPFLMRRRPKKVSRMNMGHPGRHSDPDDRYNDPHWRLDQ